MHTTTLQANLTEINIIALKHLFIDVTTLITDSLQLTETTTLYV